MTDQPMGPDGADGPPQEAPRIEFPCRYPIKIMGLADDDFSETVISVCRRHAPEVTSDSVTIRPSSKGNYVAVTVVIEATGLEQLEVLFADLKAISSVKLVL